MELQPGLAAIVEKVVEETDTSSAAGTSDVAMLATPSIILLAEQATWAAIEGRLEEGTSAVEHRVEISHLAPTPVGAKVKAEAVLEAVEGRRLVFRISVSDDRGLVAAGRFTRVIVSKDRFMEKAGGLAG
ncbi:MAG TPA: hotdog domain-containing protein [Acidimicrobiia bacterium]|nr:hotdog domain-containing protein [Acidimicrobiia bacterium]